MMDQTHHTPEQRDAVLMGVLQQDTEKQTEALVEELENAALGFHKTHDMERCQRAKKAIKGRLSEIEAQLEAAGNACGNCFEGKSDMDHDCKKCSGTGHSRYEQQAAGTHPAPCARFCEAQAFHSELRRLKSENEQLRAGYDAARLEIASLQAQLEAVGAVGVGALRKPRIGARWYMLNKEGMATLCVDKEDAEQNATDAQASWPHMGPHYAAQMEAIDAAIAAQQGTTNGR